MSLIDGLVFGSLIVGAMPCIARARYDLAPTVVLIAAASL
jgi:hypothetical protein